LGVKNLRYRNALWLIWGLALAAGLAGYSLTRLQAASDRPLVNIITIEGVIDPSGADYLERALAQAEGDGAQCLIVKLNTPGGMGTAMDKMVGLLLNSPLPVVVYVTPSGGEAFSAGTFITLAANFAVMDPHTAIGAAHPMQLFSLPSQEGESKSAQGQAEAVMVKITNAYVTKIRNIAEKRGRNADWAEQAVRDSKSNTAKEALVLKVIDSLQPSQATLLQWLEGKTTQVAGDKTVTLHIRDAQVVAIDPSIKDRFLHRLADPNLLLILMVLAVMGIIFELQNPGAILPGVIGGISLLLALYAMSVLPVTTAGLALIGFALLLFIADIKVPSHGILTAGGIASFILGGVMLIDDKRYGGVLKVSWQVILAMAALLVGFFLIVIGAAVRAHLRRPTTGIESFPGKVGRALSGLSPEEDGEVLLEGERWRARSRQGNIGPEEKVEVVSLQGLTLIVQVADKGETPKAIDRR
jgi:membrane-bound serine protease (ClpP class)